MAHLIFLKRMAVIECIKGNGGNLPDDSQIGQIVRGLNQADYTSLVMWLDALRS